MKVYNVMQMTRYDYDFSVFTYQEGCYFNKQDAIKRKEVVIEEVKSSCTEEIERYSDEDSYPEASDGALYIENYEIYFDLEYGFEEDHVVHQVWIDELEVK